MANPIRSLMGLAAIGLLLAAGACARPTGDFGRAEADPLHDTVMPTLGGLRSHSVKAPVSDFNLTDQEREMRDRIWRYLVAPHAYDWFGDTAAELQRTGLAPISTKPLRTDRYYLWIHSERFASSRTRYGRLADDVATDIATMPTTFASICAVLEVDRQRGVASNGIDGLEDKVTASAAARQGENRAQIGWFVRAASNRYDSYSYALDHLLVETPHEEAVKVNALLSDLAVYVEAADRGDFCSPVGGTKAGGATALHSRYLHSDGVAKGS